MSGRRIVILGNGVAGATCALELRARDDRAQIQMVSDESDYFFSRTALMYALMDKLSRRGLEPYERHHWDRLRIDRVRARAKSIDGAPSSLALDDGRSLAFDALVIATGARARALSIPGIETVREGLTSFVTLSDLDRCEALIPSTQRAVVVGGGLIGVELVECLVHHGVHTTWVVRERWPWPAGLGEHEGRLVADHLRNHRVDLRLEDELSAVEADASGRVKSVSLSSGERLACELLGVAIGVAPNVEWLSSSANKPEVQRGIVVDDRLRTSLPSVWAAGDCAVVKRDDALVHEPIWYTAKRHGAFVARQLTGSTERYCAPVFKNSAKFFELEYTAVGEAEPSRHPSVLLALPSGPRCARLFHRDGVLTGFSALGSRWDTTVIARWVDEQRPLDWARARLREAQFDPEFSRAPVEQLQEHTR
jgi:NADPH-dependent 2,4-dienoyl-CoA reductase/sulfur reductase-like enzyme